MSRGVLYTIVTLMTIVLFGGGIARPVHAIEITYDSLSGPLFSGGSGFNNLTEVGQSITLGGTERVVTLFEVLLFFPPENNFPGTNDFTINFYQADGAGSEPGALLWTSPTQNLSGGTMVIFPVSVPSIAVPDTFIWTVETSAFGATVHNAALPTVGSNNDQWFHFTDGSWFTSASPATFGFGARVTADLAPPAPVPEPSTLLLLGSSLVGMFGLRSIRSHRLLVDDRM